MTAKTILKNTLLLALFIFIIKVAIEPLFTEGSYQENFNDSLNRIYQMPFLAIWIGVSILGGVIKTFIRRRR